MVIRDAIRDGAELLKASGCGSPFLDASLLLGAASGKDKERILASYPEDCPEAVRAAYAALLARRAAREPLHYILGKREFLGRDFEVGPAVLVPRPETEFLAEEAIRLALEAWSEEILSGRPGDGPIRIHDACAGSGCVGVSIAAELQARGRPGRFEVSLSDLSPRALDVASRNAVAILGRPLPAYLADALDGIPPGPYRVIAANPPYLDEAEMGAMEPELAFEPRMALHGGAGGLAVFTALASRAMGLLSPGGAFLSEIGHAQGARAAEELKRVGFERVRVRRDLSGLDRIAEGRKPAGGAGHG
jgi:release factor glutamine methyltransferase